MFPKRFAVTVCLVCNNLAPAVGLSAETAEDAVASGSAAIIGVGCRLFSSRVGFLFIDRKRVPPPRKRDRYSLLGSLTLAGRSTLLASHQWRVWRNNYSPLPVFTNPLLHQRTHRQHHSLQLHFGGAVQLRRHWCVL